MPRLGSRNGDRIGMKLFAVSDLHLSYEANRKALVEIESCPDDWLILAGDVGETTTHLELAFETLKPRFAQLVWVPGNHELWTMPSKQRAPRGKFKYDELVALCKSYGVITPEDAYPIVAIDGQYVRIAPLFLLYDYSFRPREISIERAVDWAGETGVVCSDEILLHPAPYAGITEWCHARCDWTEHRLKSFRNDLPTVLINHFPLREDLATLPRIPRFSLWCGTRRTEDWHMKYNAIAVVSGHLHIRSTSYRDGVRFEEVSFGYPRQWTGSITLNRCVREILPGSTPALQIQTKTV
jgi:3',5'-cyclic AMP phosphodiesterase CpdA